MRLEGPASDGCWTLLLFLGSRCEGCLPFWSVPREPTAYGLLDGDVALVVTRDPGAEDPDALRSLAGAGEGVGGGADGAGAGAGADGGADGAADDRAAHVVMSGAAWRAYRVHGPPFFVLVVGGEVVSEGVAWSAEQLTADVARARRTTRPAGEGRGGESRDRSGDRSDDRSGDRSDDRSDDRSG